MKVSEEYLEWCFNHCDADGSGYLTEEELDFVAYIAGSVHTKEDIRKQVMEKLDTDGTPDGKISYKEFCEFIRQQPDPRQQLFKAFKVFDKDDNGLMDKSELKEVLCWDEEIDEQEVEETLEKFDVDGDGKLNIAEFITFMTETQQD